MKKILILCCFAIAVWSCKDEFNIPESNSYIDGTAPEITIISPQDNNEYPRLSSLPLHIEITDDYSVETFNITITQQDSLYPLFDFTQENIDSNAYSYSGNFTIPNSGSSVFEIYINSTDLVGNNNNEVLTITTI